MKKQIAIIAALSLVASAAFVSCSKSSTSTSSSSKDGVNSTFSDTSDNLSSIIPKETVTLQVYDQLANYSGEQIGWFAKVLLDKFNVKLNIIPESGGVYETRMESGNLGDIVVWGNDSDNYLNAVNKGMLFNWDDEDLLSDYGPYIKKHFAHALEKNRTISKTGLYGFGHAVSESAQDRQDFMYTWDLRYDLYEKIGSPEIKNLDDLVDVLEKMHEVCPTDDNGNPTYGASIFNDWDGNTVMFVKALATAYWGYDEFGFGLWDSSTQKFHDCLEKNGPYYQALKFYNKLYQKGLLDPDSQTQKYDGMMEDFQNGTAFFNIFNFMGSSLYNTAKHEAAGKIMKPVKPEDAVPICYGQNVYGGNRVWSIGADTEYPELCMAILNYFSTPNGFMTTEYGPKGVTWDYDENNKTYFTELGKKTNQDQKTEMPAPYTGNFHDGSFQLNNVTWAVDATNPISGEPFNYSKWASEITPAQYPIDAAWRKWSGANTADDYLAKQKYILCPGTQFSDSPQSDELKVKWNQVSTCIKNNSWKAIYAKNDSEFKSLWNTMVKEANSYGYDECTQFQLKEGERRAAAENAINE